MALNNIAFLLEGSRLTEEQRTQRGFFEITAAIKLAKANGCEIFDSIASFNEEHISEAIKNCAGDEGKQKILVLTIFLMFVDEGSAQAIIDKFIKGTYAYLLDTHQIDHIPSWVEALNASTIDSFAGDLLKKYFDSNYDNFKPVFSKNKSELSLLSDRISSRQLLEFINAHKEITTVYCLIGKNHLTMLDRIGKIIEERDGFKRVSVQVGDRTIDVYLFGGTHGEDAHYLQLVANIKKDSHLVVPADCEKTGGSDLASILIKLLLPGLPTEPSRELAATDSEHLKENDRSFEEKPVPEIVTKFEHWFKTYHHDSDVDNVNLLRWLYYDNGGMFIKDYSHFCEIASSLAKKRYKTNPPPSKVEFNKSMKHFEEAHKRYRGSVAPTDERFSDSRSEHPKRGVELKPSAGSIDPIPEQKPIEVAKYTPLMVERHLVEPATPLVVSTVQPTTHDEKNKYDVELFAYLHSMK